MAVSVELACAPSDIRKYSFTQFAFFPQVHDPVVKHSVHTLVFRSLKRTHDMFLAHEGQPVEEDELA